MDSSDGFEHITQPLEDVKEKGVVDNDVVSGEGRTTRKTKLTTTRKRLPVTNSKAAQTNPEDETPETRPTWTRMHLRYLSTEVLEENNIDYVIDSQNPEYVLIQRWVPEYEQDFLWAATRASRTRRNSENRRSSSPYPSRVRSNRASSPGIIEVRVGKQGAELKLDINRMEFKDWAGSKYMEQRGKHVLDVAVEDGKAIRVAINSEALRDELRIVIGAGVGLVISEWRRVLTGPWKVLVEYEEAIKSRLHKLEEMMKSRDETLAENPVEDKNKVTDRVHEDRRSDRKVRFRDPPSSCEVCDVVYPPHETPLACIDTRVAHLKCLIEFMDYDLRHVFDLRQQIKDGSVTEIAFTDLWHLFSPGDLIVTYPMSRAYRVFHTSGGRLRLSKPELFEKKTVGSPFNINCFYMNSDWKTVGPIHETLRISEYAGKKPVSELLVELDGKLMTERVTVFPLKLLSISEQEEETSHLIARGKKSRAFKKGDHKYYLGSAGEEVSNSSNDEDLKFAGRPPGYGMGPFVNLKKEREEIKSEIIIDSEYETENKAIGLFDAIEFDSRETAENCTHYGVSNNQYFDDRGFQRDCRCSDLVVDNVVDNDRAAKYKDDMHLLHPCDVNDELEDEFLMLLPPTVEGFVLEKKKWKMLSVDTISDLKQESVDNPVNFKALMVPEGHESLLKALVGTHSSSQSLPSKTSRDPSSLAILLHGPKSTGKFLTVKALASHFNRPLYTITSADLGITTWDAARELATHFKRATKWNCIIAIPDAERRFPHRKSPSDGDSNMSGLFLRELELFKGVVILTTDTKDDVEEQVVRGMNVCLGSDFWSRSENLRVWQQVLKKRGIFLAKDNDELPAGTTATIAEADYDRWLRFINGEYRTGKRWSGVEMDNYFDTALALAAYDTDSTSGSMYILKDSHLSIAARVTGTSVFSVL
ncbi:putative atpase aaa+ type core protein [Botrytis fragariae]|uniref:Putative atpase aaa+ type core protein n=1 Tax=Botrytis fragariae TaxID=1964551 RepID=A0A8H6AXR4_9HELO|nr:putative atpase aaa+ type core protein [Botrytis fragariae]KAF5875726.1 putative atpase aaa+ type core protein [Botrytis fragariae]